MNVLFVVAAGLLVLIGAAHSILGERRLLIPMFRDGASGFFREVRWARNVLRFAWHLTTMAWWGMAVVIVDLSTRNHHLPVSVYALTVTFFVTGITILAFSKGRHFAWIVFLAIAGCLLAGA